MTQDEFSIPNSETVSPTDIHSNTDLSGADLTDANLRGADLSDAKLFSTDLTGADLTDADLTGAILPAANLSNVNFSDANLTDADLSYANLSGADLSDADLTDTTLSNANLLGVGEVDFSDATEVPGEFIDLEQRQTEDIRADMRGSVTALTTELTEGRYEHDLERLTEIESEARAIADYAEELASRHREMEHS
ncbi:pentapeptide repeat-containing protein, partial [Haloquadratum walsbyi]